MQLDDFGCDCFRAMAQSAKEICNNLYLEKRLQILGLDYRWRYEAAKGRSRGSSRGHRKLLCGRRLPGDWQWPLAASLIATTYSRLVASFLYFFNVFPSLLCPIPVFLSESWRMISIFRTDDEEDVFEERNLKKISGILSFVCFSNFDKSKLILIMANWKNIFLFPV